MVLYNLSILNRFLILFRSVFERNNSKTLKKFKVNPKQLYTITTDNGANIVKAVQLIENEIEIVLESENDSEPENHLDSGEILSPDISLDDHNSDSSIDSESNRLILLHIMQVYFIYLPFLNVDCGV